MSIFPTIHYSIPLTKSFIHSFKALFSLCNPNPHKFNSVCLQSAGWDKKSIQELFSEMRQNLPLYRSSTESYRSALDELKIFRKAKSLDDKLANKSANREMNEIMSHYETYFDEDSGNSREEGVQQLQEYLEGEAKTHFNTYRAVKLKLDQIKQEIEKRKAVEDKKDIEDKKAVENEKIVEDTEKAVDQHKNTFLSILPILPMNSFTIIRLFLTIFSLFISFKFIDFDLNYLIVNIPEIAIVTSIVLFVWEYYRLYSKVRKYCKIGKIIYMHCKKKLDFFQKKIVK